MLRIAHYGRKSIFSDKSDSVSVQYNLSSEYCKSHHADHRLYRYEDEGFTGANIDRPDYNRLIEDVRQGKLDVVVCYKIDRVSRNVLDFSSFFNLLTEHNVAFVSIKEQIDTSTPLGRAMMYICSVFAQMERETIAERVGDALLELAKAGYWAGGKPPCGFSTEKIIVDGKSHSKLIEKSDELSFFYMIVDTFLEGYSLNRLEAHFRQNDIKTLLGNYLSATQLYSILKSPFCAPADESTYDYFEKLGCRMAVDKKLFDGTHGLSVYGRTSGGKKKKHTVNSPEKWTVSVGLHYPLLTSEKWLAVQNRFGANSIDRTRKHKLGILKGVLKCSCGWTMRVQHKVDKTYGKTYDNYFCQNRNRRGVEYCDRKFTPVADLDDAVIKMLKEISLDKSVMENYIDDAKNTFAFRHSRNDLQRKIASLNSKIENLTSALSSNNSSSAAKYVIAEIEKLDNSLISLNFELMELEEVERKRNSFETDKEAKYKLICEIVKCLDTATYDDINTLIKNVFKECVYDGESLKIRL